MIKAHLEEIRARLGYYMLAYLLCFSLIFWYLPVLFSYSPFFFLHSRWEDAFWCLLVIALLLAFGCTFPLLVLHGYLWVKPALHQGAELAILHLALQLTLTAHTIFWMSAPVLLFRLPSFMLSFQSENLLFTPLLNDFLSIVQDFAFSSLNLYLLPILILAHFSRSFIYFFACLVSSLFMDSAAFIGLVFLPLAFYIETTFIVIIAWKHYFRVKY